MAYHMDEWGGEDGTFWTDGTYSSIKTITIRHGTVIDAIQVKYGLPGENEEYDIPAPQHGGSGGSESKITFAEDEYITKIEGYVDSYYGHKVIASLTFTTNKTKYPSYGTQVGDSFESSGNEKIVGFHGRAGAGVYLNCLGIYALRDIK